MISIDTIVERMREIFITKDVFELRLTPLEKGFYGAISLILLTVLGAVITLVVRK